MPRRSAGHPQRVPGAQFGGLLFVDDEFRRLQAFQFGLQCFRVICFGQAKTASRQVQPCEADRFLVDKDGRDQVIAGLGEQRFVCQRARRDDSRHLALDRPLAGCRIPDLFTDRYRLALAHELRQVSLGRMIRHASHRNRVAATLAARRERDIQEHCCPLGVIEKQLVEVPHAVKQEHVRIFALDTQILLHHRRVHRSDVGAHREAFCSVCC